MLLNSLCTAATDCQHAVALLQSGETADTLAALAMENNAVGGRHPSISRLAGVLIGSIVPLAHPGAAH